MGQTLITDPPYIANTAVGVAIIQVSKVGGRAVPTRTQRRSSYASYASPAADQNGRQPHSYSNPTQSSAAKATAAPVPQLPEETAAAASMFDFQPGNQRAVQFSEGNDAGSGSADKDATTQVVENGGSAQSGFEHRHSPVRSGYMRAGTALGSAGFSVTRSVVSSPRAGTTVDRQSPVMFPVKSFGPGDGLTGSSNGAENDEGGDRFVPAPSGKREDGVSRPQPSSYASNQYSTDSSDSASSPTGVSSTYRRNSDPSSQQRSPLNKFPTIHPSMHEELPRSSSPTNDGSILNHLRTASFERSESPLGDPIRASLSFEGQREYNSGSGNSQKSLNSLREEEEGRDDFDRGAGPGEHQNHDSVTVLVCIFSHLPRPL